MRRSARLQPPRHHGPSHGRTSRPLRGRSSRTRSRASSHPVRGDAPSAGRPASGSYPRTAGNGPSAPARMEDRRRATPIQSRQRTMPRHAHARRGRETERRTDAPPFLIFFWTVRLKPHDRNRLNARATQCRTPKGSACSRTLRRPALSLDQTVQKKKIFSVKETS